MKTKAKLLTLLFYTLLVAGSGYSKIASAACLTFVDSAGSATAICW